MAQTHDVKIIRYGTFEGHQQTDQPLTASETVYRGTVAATRSGYIKNMATPQSTDVVWGLIDGAVAFKDTGAGITNPNTTNGGVSIDIQTGSFVLFAGTSGDALAQSDVGSAVYLIDEVTVGKTNGSATRPVAGTLLNTPTGDPSIPTGMVAVKVGSAPPGTGSP